MFSGWAHVTCWQMSPWILSSVHSVERLLLREMGIFIPWWCWCQVTAIMGKCHFSNLPPEGKLYTVETNSKVPALSSGWGPTEGGCAAGRRGSMLRVPSGHRAEVLPTAPLGWRPKCQLLISVLTQTFSRKNQFQNLRAGLRFVCYHNKVPQCWWLKAQKLTVSQFWGPWSTSKMGSLWGLWGQDVSQAASVDWG